MGGFSLNSKAYGTREDILLQIFLAFFLLLAQGFELLLKHDAVSSTLRSSRSERVVSLAEERCLPLRSMSR